MLAVLLALGCHSGEHRCRAENDRLNRELVDARREVERLKGELEEARGKLATVRALQDAASRAHPLFDARCRKRGDEWVLEGKAASDVLDDLSSAVNTGRWLPYEQGGATAGWRLVRARFDSLLASCGLRPGDLVESVDGRELPDLDAVRAAGEQARRARRAEIKVRRGGRELSIRLRALP